MVKERILRHQEKFLKCSLKNMANIVDFPSHLEFSKLCLKVETNKPKRINTV